MSSLSNLSPFIIIFLGGNFPFLLTMFGKLYCKQHIHDNNRSRLKYSVGDNDERHK